MTLPWLSLPLVIPSQKGCFSLSGFLENLSCVVRQFGLGFSEVVFSVGSPGTSSGPQEPGPGFGITFVLVGLFHLETLLW